MIREKWPTLTLLSAETVLGAFKNAREERWKNLWIRTF
jgi:hypothetical protein